jgi:hypothetical protein
MAGIFFPEIQESAFRQSKGLPPGEAIFKLLLEHHAMKMYGRVEV